MLKRTSGREAAASMIVRTSESALRNVIGALDARCEVALVEVTRFSAPQAAWI
jgi:hypothetical protein